MFESRISAEATEKSLGWKNRTRKQAVGLLIWTVMRRIAWTDIANWQIKRLSNCFCKFSTPCLDDQHFKKGGKGNGWRILQRLLSNRSEKPKNDTTWLT